MDELTLQITEIISDKLDIYEKTIKLESNIRDDLGANNHDMYELVCTIENEINISIFEHYNDVDMDGFPILPFKTVGELINFINSQQK